jgi:hypothetical protein
MKHLLKEFADLGCHDVRPGGTRLLLHNARESKDEVRRARSTLTFGGNKLNP